MKALKLLKLENEIKSKLKSKNIQKYIHLNDLILKYNKIIMKNINKIYNREKILTGEEDGQWIVI